MTYFAHPTAIIDEGCQIGSDSKIWHFCHLMHNSIIGRSCVLGQNVMVANGVILGDRVKVQNNVSIYNGVTCENDVFLGPSMVFTNVINPRSEINRKDQFRKTLVKKGASIGANATIICGVQIGTYAMIGAGSVVTKDVPDFGLIVGNPGYLIGFVSRSGHRLNFDDDDRAQCPQDKTKYIKLDNIVLEA